MWILIASLEWLDFVKKKILVEGIAFCCNCHGNNDSSFILLLLGDLRGPFFVFKIGVTFIFRVLLFL